MYKNTSLEPKMANLPYFLDTTLNVDNRWVKLSTLIPWSDVEEIYALNFTSQKGPKAISARAAFGSLIIQVKLSLTDEETVETIAENPYMQYFIGLERYEQKAPFDSSMMTHFRNDSTPKVSRILTNSYIPLLEKSQMFLTMTLMMISHRAIKAR